MTAAPASAPGACSRAQRPGGILDGAPTSLAAGAPPLSPAAAGGRPASSSSAAGAPPPSPALTPKIPPPLAPLRRPRRPGSSPPRRAAGAGLTAAVPCLERAVAMGGVAISAGGGACGPWRWAGLRRRGLGRAVAHHGAHRSSPLATLHGRSRTSPKQGPPPVKRAGHRSPSRAQRRGARRRRAQIQRRSRRREEGAGAAAGGCAGPACHRSSPPLGSAREEAARRRWREQGSTVTSRAREGGPLGKKRSNWRGNGGVFWSFRRTL